LGWSDRFATVDLVISTLAGWTTIRRALAPRRRLGVGIAVIGIVASTGGGSCETPSPPVPDSPVTYQATVVETLPHDTGAFTQGLELIDGRFIESTGLYGSSSIRLVDPATGTVLRSKPLLVNFFGEGATVVPDPVNGDTVWQITWTSGTAFRYRLSDFSVLAQVAYDGQGWGICHDGRRLIMSDGSDTLTFRDPDTFAVLGTVAVTDEGNAVSSLNELECVQGRVWANLWPTANIVEIDPDSGAVTGRLDISDLVPADSIAASRDNVANGIAYDDQTGNFYLAGKRWPVLYEVELDPIN
jgi:glutaminyl-peptide cyclotransferase